MTKILIINKFLMPKEDSETYIIQIGDCLGQVDHDVQYFGMDRPGHTLGNRINQYTSNVDLHAGDFGRLAYSLRVLYPKETRQRLTRVLEDFQPDAVHISNFNYQLTPSVLHGIRDHERRSRKRAAVLYTAHGYQLICPNHMLDSLGDGQNYKLCVDGHHVSRVRKRCIHLSMAKSLLGAAEGMVHRKLEVYQYIDRVICPSYFMEEKVSRVNLFRGRITTMHNFAVHREEVPGVKEDYILYFERYSRGEGIETLLRACRELPDIPFVLAGVRPLEDRIRSIPDIKNLGFVRGEGLNRLIREARFSIYLSEYYENCPPSIMESQLLRTPVLGARIEGIPELIQEGVNGALFTSGDLEDLEEKIRYLRDRSQLCAQWSGRCRDIPYGTVGMYCNKLPELYGIGREG